MNRKNFNLNIIEIDDLKEIKLDDCDINCVNIGHNRICYSYSTKELSGKFDINKAKALGLPKGPLFGLLKAGNSVNVNGKEIFPHDVLGPSEKSRSTLVNCSLEGKHSILMDSLVNSSFFYK